MEIADPVELHPIHQMVIDEGYETEPDQYSKDAYDKAHDLKDSIDFYKIKPDSLAKDVESLAYQLREIVSEPWSFEKGEWIKKGDRPFVDATLEFLEKMSKLAPFKG
jgi:hypothetical protein